MRIVAPLLALAACGPPYGGACEQLTQTQCDVCPQQSDYEDLMCTCQEEGTLTKNDAPDGYFDTDQDAEMACSEFLFGLKYPSESTAAYCKQQVEMFDEYDKDYCDYSGYGTYEYSYYGSN